MSLPKLDIHGWVLGEQRLKLQQRRRPSRIRTQRSGTHGNALCPLPTVWCAQWWQEMTSGYSRERLCRVGLAKGKKNREKLKERERERRGFNTLHFQRTWLV